MSLYFPIRWCYPQYRQLQPLPSPRNTSSQRNQTLCYRGINKTVTNFTCVFVLLNKNMNWIELENNSEHRVRFRSLEWDGADWRDVTTLSMYVIMTHSSIGCIWSKGLSIQFYKFVPFTINSKIDWEKKAQIYQWIMRICVKVSF